LFREVNVRTGPHRGVHGLQTYYKENNDITRLVRRAAVLPLVPQHLDEDVWLNPLEDIGEAGRPKLTG
jgi:hypothetical protein